MGLADVLVPQDQVRSAALALAAEIAENAPLGLMATRATLRGDLADRVARRPSMSLPSRCGCARPRISRKASRRWPSAAFRFSPIAEPAQATNKTQGRGHPPMAVRVEKNGSVWTVIHDRPEARNAMDPASADALTAAFLEFDADKTASVAVFYGAGGAFCAGWDLKYVSRSTRRIRSANSTSRPPDRAAMAAKFRAARSDRRGSNWTSR